MTPRLRDALAVALVALAPATVPAADPFALDLAQLVELSPRPGLTLGAANLDDHALLLDPDLRRFIAGGMLELEIGQPIEFRPHPAYVEATSRFLGQPALGSQSGVLETYAQGRPFPAAPATSDAQAGTKAAWNMRYAWFGDSGLIPEMHWQLRDWASEKVEFEMTFRARSMRFMFRHVLEPVPFVDDNPQDAFGAFLLTAVDAGSYDDTQALVFVNRDESRPVNGWVYLPQLGRTQTLASFATGESMFGSDILPTDFLAYAGRLVDMDWRFVGTSYALLPFYRHDQARLSTRQARSGDYWHVDFGGRAGCFPQVAWQVRPVILLEGTARDATARVQRRLFTIDAQTYAPALWKAYRADGSLWKIALAAYAHPDSHLPANQESGAPILSAFSTIDIGTNRCTTVQLMTVVNSAEVEAADFDPGIMQSGGRGEFRRR